MKFSCSFGIFLNSAHLICVSEGPLELSRSTVDCIYHIGRHDPRWQVKILGEVRANALRSPHGHLIQAAMEINNK